MSRKKKWAKVFFGGEISPNFELKNMILTYTKDLMELKKRGPKITRF
jgi:hypothetical protein